MLSRSLAVLVVMFVAGVLVAGEYTGVVTKFGEKELTATIQKDKKDKKGEEKTFKVGKDVKIEKTVEDKAEAVTATDFTKSVEEAAKKEKGPKGVRCKITTEGEGDKEVVTKISLVTGKKK